MSELKEFWVEIKETADDRKTHRAIVSGNSIEEVRETVGKDWVIINIWEKTDDRMRFPVAPNRLPTKTKDQVSIVGSADRQD